MNDELENLIKELQHNFAKIDLITLPQDNNRRTRLLLLKTQNIKVKIYQEKAHKNPHIHIDYGKQKHFASYEITTRNKIDGNLSSRYDKTITQWIELNQEIILNIWNNLQNGKNTLELVASLNNNEQ